MPRKRKQCNQEIEIGDWVEMLDGINTGFVGLYEGEFYIDGMLKQIVLENASQEAEAFYVNAIKLYKKA
jgi:hypothetical protein